MWIIFPPQLSRTHMRICLLCMGKRLCFSGKEKVTGEVTHSAEKAFQQVYWASSEVSTLKLQVPVKYCIFPSVRQLHKQCPNKSVILGPALHHVQLQLVTTSYLFGRQGEGAHVGTWSASWYGSSRCPAPRSGWWRRQNHCPLWTGSCWLKCAC